MSIYNAANIFKISLAYSLSNNDRAQRGITGTVTGASIDCFHSFVTDRGVDNRYIVNIGGPKADGVRMW